MTNKNENKNTRATYTSIDGIEKIYNSKIQRNTNSDLLQGI